MEEYDPLKYWENNEKRFPRLAQMAYQYLAVPVGSVGVERRFSTVGRVTHGRWRLHTSTIEALVMLKDYIDDPDFKDAFSSQNIKK